MVKRKLSELINSWPTTDIQNTLTKIKEIVENAINSEIKECNEVDNYLELCLSESKKLENDVQELKKECFTQKMEINRMKQKLDSIESIINQYSQCK